jgi:uncharacterized phage-associated protein
MRMKVKKEKLKQVIHYIVNTCQCKDNFGKTVLYKLLYFSDFDFFEMNEKSITNETYLKYPKGPVPKHFNELKDEMVEERIIAEKKEGVFKGSKFNQYYYTSLKNPITNLLDEKELNVINDVIERLSHLKGSKISDYSHGDIPWRATDDYEPLEYELVFYRNDPYSMISNDN